MSENNENLKCTYFKKGCLANGPGCTIDQMIECETAKLWSSVDEQKCPALNFVDGCDIPDMRRLIIADAGICYNNGECMRKLYPEIQVQISRNPDLRAMAKSIQQRRLQKKQGLGNNQCCLDLATAT